MPRQCYLFLGFLQGKWIEGYLSFLIVFVFEIPREKDALLLRGDVIFPIASHASLRKIGSTTGLDSTFEVKKWSDVKLLVRKVGSGEKPQKMCRICIVSDHQKEWI
jgi:hypothetical protein